MAWIRASWWIVLAAHILLVWWAPYWITQDGSAHLYTASVVWQLFFENAPQLDAWFVINSPLNPTWGVTALLAITSAFVGPAAAEKLLVSLIILLTAIAFRRVLGALGVRSPAATWLIFPFLFNHLLWMGLYGFLLSTAGTLWLGGWLYDHWRTLSWRQSALLALFFLALYYVHPLPAALLGAGGLVGIAWIQWREQAGSFHLLRIMGGSWWKLALSGFPSGICFALYLVGAEPGQGMAMGRGLSAVIDDVITVSVLVPFSKTPQWWSTLLMAAMTIFSLRVLLLRLRSVMRWEGGDGLLILMVCLLFLMSWIPEGVTDGTLVSYRLVFFFWLAWLLWCGVWMNRHPHQPMARLLPVAAVMALVMQTVATVQHLREIQPFIRAVEEISKHIPDHAMVWPVVHNPQGRRPDGTMLSPRNPYFVHLGLHFLSGRRDVAALNAYQAEVDHFPLRFRFPNQHRYFRDGYDEKPGTYVIAEKPAEAWVLTAGSDEVIHSSITSRNTEFGVVGLAPVTALRQVD